MQLPITISGTLYTTWGAFSFPFIFLATDLTVRIFGAELARRIILMVMLPALAVSYVLSVLFFEGHIRVLVNRPPLTRLSPASRWPALWVT